MTAYLKHIFISVLLLSLLGCATAYKPYGMGGGYKERKIDDDTYIVSFFGNGYATSQRVWNFWFYRCAELTVKNGYDFFEYKPSEEHAGLEGEEGEKPVVFTMLETGKGKAVKAAYNQPVYYYYITTYSSKGLINMYKAPVPKNTGLLFDAKSVMQQLKPYVVSDGKEAPPTKRDVLVRAAVEAAIRANRIKESEKEAMQNKLYKIL